jgi:hypothetical protein
MITRLTIARHALNYINEDASIIPIDLGRKMVEAGINPVAVEAIGRHFPNGGPSVDGWAWAFDLLVDAGAGNPDAFYADAARAGYYAPDEE